MLPPSYSHSSYLNNLPYNNNNANTQNSFSIQPQQQQQLSMSQTQQTQQFFNQTITTNNNHESIILPTRQNLLFNPNISNMNINNYPSHNFPSQVLMSPAINDENRLFGFYSPSNKDIYSPQALSSTNVLQFLGHPAQAQQNHNINNYMQNQQQQQQYPYYPQDEYIPNVMQHQFEFVRRPEIDAYAAHRAFQLQAMQEANARQENAQLLPVDPVELKLEIYTSIVMQQTLFNHVSLQIFFILILTLVLQYQIDYKIILGYLLVIDVVSVVFGCKRTAIEIEVDETKRDDNNRFWIFVELIFSVGFKICLYVYLEVEKYKFYYVPCTLLIYVLIRFFFVISKKLTQNGPLSNLLNESFTWGFKIFFVGQLFLIAVKMSDKIDWVWQDVFWPYWVFFYIMIGTNSVFVILLLSKILLKCLGQPVQSFEIKGLFWFFMLSNGLCVNSTLFVRGVVSKLDHSKEGDAQIAFKYSLGFIAVFILYTVFFWRGIWIFMFHFSQEREDSEGDAYNSKSESHIRSSKRSRVSKSRQNNGGESDSNTTHQQQGIRQDGGVGGNNNNQGDDDGDEEDENDIYGEDENYPAEQPYQDSETGRARRSSNMNNELGGEFHHGENGNHQNQQNLQQGGQEGNPQQQKNKIFKKVNISSKTSNKKGIPLFLEKLSSTYFTALTNNGLKLKKDGNNQDTQRQKDVSAIRQSKRSNKSNNHQFEPEKTDKKSVSQLDIGKERKDIHKDEMNKSEMIQRPANTSKTRSPNQKKKRENSLKKQGQQDQILSDSVGAVEISFNEDKAPKNQKKQPEDIKKLNKFAQIAYDAQIKFNELISSPKSQELKKKELEKKKREAIDKKSDNNNNNDKNNVIKNNNNQKNGLEPAKKVAQQTTDQTVSVEHVINVSADESNASCVICFENDPDSVYLPCGHGGICYECAMDVMKKTGECYLCRYEIKQVVQIDIKSKDSQKKVLAVTAALDDKTEANDPDKTLCNSSQIANHNGSQTSERSGITIMENITLANNQNNNNNSNNNNNNNNIYGVHVNNINAGDNTNSNRFESDAPQQPEELQISPNFPQQIQLQLLEQQQQRELQIQQQQQIDQHRQQIQQQQIDSISSQQGNGNHKENQGNNEYINNQSHNIEEEEEEGNAQIGQFIQTHVPNNTNNLIDFSSEIDRDMYLSEQP